MFNCVLTFCKPNNNVIISSCRCVIDVIVNSAYQIKATVKMQNMLSFNFLNSKSKNQSLNCCENAKYTNI